MYKGNEGKCYGTWDETEPACAKCLIFARTRCEKLTRRKRAQENSGMLESDAMSEVEKRNDLNDYFFGLLDVKIGRPTVQWGEPLATHYYYGPDKKLVLFVGCDASTGKLKVVVPTAKKIVILTSTEQADALVKELLG